MSEKTDDPRDVAQEAEAFREQLGKLEAELGRIVVGQQAVVRQTLVAILAGGHVLLEGVPGLGKTLLCRSLSQALDLSFRRIQFTPDLMPADILGTQVVRDDASGRKVFEFQPGPIFGNLVLADEINRATPKTQSALLEAMQEGFVTTAGEQRPLPDPFFVLATQNPIEQEGTYPLPEAQLDRFMFNILVDYPTEDEEFEIMKRTTGGVDAAVGDILSGEEIQTLQDIVRRVPIADHVTRYAMRLVRATRHRTPEAPDFIKEWLGWGAGPRACQYLILGGKARALLHGRHHVSTEDIDAVAKPVLRHRLITNFNAEAEGVTTDKIIERLLEHCQAGEVAAKA